MTSATRMPPGWRSSAPTTAVPLAGGRSHRVREPRPRRLRSCPAGGARHGGPCWRATLGAPRGGLALPGLHCAVRGRPGAGAALRRRPRRRRGDLHPAHHRRVQPSCALPAGPHHGRGLRDRAPRSAAAVESVGRHQTVVRLAAPDSPDAAVAAVDDALRRRSPGPALRRRSPAPRTSPARSGRSPGWPRSPGPVVPASLSTPPNWRRTDRSPSPSSASTTSRCPGTSCTRPTAPAPWWVAPNDGGVQLHAGAEHALERLGRHQVSNDRLGDWPRRDPLCAEAVALAVRGRRRSAGRRPRAPPAP